MVIREEKSNRKKQLHDIKKQKKKCIFGVLYHHLLYRQESFTGKHAIHKIHKKLHLGLVWRIFHILTSEDIDDIISPFFTVVCANNQ